jgi:broad specificity phosphatase PhoE
MTRFLLVRHTAHDFLAKGMIAGRQPGVHLNAAGKEEAEELAERLSILPVDAIFSSPLERAWETAAPLARKLALQVQIAEEFNEIDVGNWTNRAFRELERDEHWQRWNNFRSSTATPTGELMLDVQARAVGKISQLKEQHRFVAIFSHGDPIRAVLAHFLGLHLDLFLRLSIDPGSLTLVELGDQFVRVRMINAPAEASSAINALVHADTTVY